MRYTLSRNETPSGPRASSSARARSLKTPGLRGMALVAIALAASACDSFGDGHGHSEFSRVEIQTRGAQSAVIATWTSQNGWRNAQGAAITELPTPVDQEGVGLAPLTAGGPRASLTVRFFDRQDRQIPISTVSRQEAAPRDRTCSSDEARYVPTTASTNVIAWPNRRHPNNPNGPFHWAELPGGQLEAIFHCDHVHIYPLTAGTVDVTFTLWHVDHSDGETAPIRLRVNPAN
jgi:hypothetical protein